MPPRCAACPANMYADHSLRLAQEIVTKNFFLRLLRQKGKGGGKLRMIQNGGLAAGGKKIFFKLLRLGKRIEFSGPEPLGADDLRILQGLVAMAGPNGLVLGPEPKTEGGRQLRLFLEPKWEAVTADAMVVKGSYRALAKEIGAEVDSGGALKHIQDCIERLWKVSIIAQNGRKRQGFRLLSEYASDEADGRLYVALNPLIAQAVMGGGQHVRISMDEVRALDSETARLLHQRLCGWIDPGKTGKASIDTLCGYVWPSEASGSTMRKRRQRVREALPELVALGWTVTEFAAGKYDITRPKAAG